MAFIHGAKRIVCLWRLNAGHDRVAIRLGRGGGRVSAMSNARTRGREEEKQQDFFTSFRELTMEMRQNETRDERRETRGEKNERRSGEARRRRKGEGKKGSRGRSEG